MSKMINFARHELRNTRPLTDKSQLYDGCLEPVIKRGKE